MSVFTNPANGTAEEAAQYGVAVVALVGDRDPVLVLRETPDRLAALIKSLTVQAAATPEAPQKWSIAAVLQHLADAEVVWAYRLRMVLAQDRPRIIGYDQDRLAARLHYQESDMREARRDFEAFRRANLRVLAGLSADDWHRVGVHATRGEQTLRVMTQWWAGHDLLHLRQIERIRRSIAPDEQIIDHIELSSED
jgi:uncharacterized damage-inducible protein DinB